MKNNQCDFLAVGLSSAIQKTVVFDTFHEGEVNRSSLYYSDASGKAVNVCRVLTQAGKSVFCLTIAGGDNRSYFEELCSRDSLAVSSVIIPGRVRICTTVLNREKNICTELVVEEPEEATVEAEENFKNAFLLRLEKKYKCLIISGSRKKGFSDKIIPFMVGKAKEKGMTVIADFRGDDLVNSCISGTIRPDYIKINEEEFFQTFSGYNDLERGVREQSGKYNSSFIITRGDRSTLVAEKGVLTEIECKLIDAVNPIGCGDAMTAGLARGIMEGRTLVEAVELGRDYATRNALSIHPGWIRED